MKKQSLVKSVISDIRPDILAIYDQSISPEEKLEIAGRHAHTSRKGTWGINDEWIYHIHGMGCKITHRLTGEPIEWDAPNTKAFDRFWFLNHTDWLINQDVKENIEAIIIKQDILDKGCDLKEYIFQAINKLVELGLLSAELEQNKYILSED